ncbi:MULTISPECIES: hypothetical protein [Exiguobacterium]|uniref:hypothetical protein n=1 Tax=Exiguobacterium TaxID=33986 RepID=UPI000877593E|nr:MULTISPECIES: hypothetical protein [Exiguobacterium]TCI60368.1 hypothetical protein EVJ26_11385 [Exiguobacterium sp. SH3S1]
MKRIVLINVAFLMEVEEAEIHKDFGVIDQVTNELCHDQAVKIGTNEVNVDWQSCSTVLLDPLSMNCGQCAACGRWTTDREKNDPVLELGNGATFKGNLLCDDCLPEHHRWSF